MPYQESKALSWGDGLLWNSAFFLGKESEVLAVPTQILFHAHDEECSLLTGRYQEAVNRYTPCYANADEAFESYEPTSMRDNIEQMMSACCFKIGNVNGWKAKYYENFEN